MAGARNDKEDIKADPNLAKPPGSGETPPPPKPDDLDEKAQALKELAETRAALKEAQEKLKAGEIKGMSESTGHAILEEIRVLQASLKAQEKEIKVEEGWFPSFGF